jgi:hypothetical protein
MTERFNVSRWSGRLRQAVANRSGNWLRELLAENDPNGTWSYSANCREFGWMSREEWIDALIESAQTMLDELSETN